MAPLVWIAISAPLAIVMRFRWIGTAYCLQAVFEGFASLGRTISVFFNPPIAWEVDHESFFLAFENDGDGNDA